MPSSTSRPAWHETRRTAALWAGLLAGPIVWAALLETNYVLSYVSCETRHEWFFHVALAAAVLLVAAAGWFAWRSGPADDDQRRSHPVTSATAESRSRWMSIAGVLLSVWFILVMLAMEIPILVLRTCQ
jgi:hypothetical protein